MLLHSPENRNHRVVLVPEQQTNGILARFWLQAARQLHLAVEQGVQLAPRLVRARLVAHAGRPAPLDRGDWRGLATMATRSGRPMSTRVHVHWTIVWRGRVFLLFSGEQIRALGSLLICSRDMSATSI